VDLRVIKNIFVGRGVGIFVPDGFEDGLGELEGVRRDIQVERSERERG
jgi:hypothetical protein